MGVLGFRHSSFLPRVAVFLVALLLRPAALVANDVTPPAPIPARPVISGFVDTHLHQFANLGFGGAEVWGSPMDPALDASAPLSTARARALPDSDFLYLSVPQALDYLYIGDVPVITTPLAATCDDGSCWPECPAGTGVSGNACVRITVHGPAGAFDLLNELVPNGSGGHGTAGYPDMNGWPAHDVLTTQQAYYEWLERAHAHGLKLIVMLAVNNSVLCKLALHRGSFGCGDDASVSRQIEGAKDLEGYIDARAGGPGQGFYRIVYNSEEARAAIADGKLAVVLGTEVDTSWGCTPGAPFCNDAYIQTQVQNFYNSGIRVVYPVHLIDNKFGGTALYTGLFELANFIVNGGAWFDIQPCGAPIEWRSDIRQTIQDAKDVVTAIMVVMIASLGALFPALDLIIAPLLAALPFVAAFMPLLGAASGALGPFLALPGLGSAIITFALAWMIWQAPGNVGAATDGNCNGRGLTAEGMTLINALMDHKMLIDIDHTDTPTFDAILTMAEANNYPGIVSGHTGLIGPALTRDEITDMGLPFHASDSGRHEANKTDAKVQRILDVGGFVSLGLAGSAGRSSLRDFSATDAVPWNCGKSTQAFAQAYLYATQTLGMTAVGFGSDMNGFAGTPGPRYGPKACGSMMDAAPGYNQNSLVGRINYATATDFFGNPLPQHTFGSRAWDYNVDGFTQVGMYPDFIADLTQLGLTNAQLQPIFNAAEAYVRMWEKVDDEEAPIWRCGTVGEDWHAGDVTVPCLSYDFGWGLENGADANFSLVTSVPDGTETGNATTNTHATICDNDGHCTGVIPAIAGINVDKKAPDITVSTPPAGTPTYILNSIVPADYGCVDGGSGVASCAGPVPTAGNLDTTIGPHQFTVTGIDNVDNTAAVAHPYNVSFAVCLQFDNTRAYRAGSTVPIKLRLCDASGANVSSHAITLTATGVVQVSTSAPGVLEDAGNSNPDNEFRHTASGDAYEFNLKTTGFATGTYALTFTATGDPIPHEVLIQIR